MLKDRFVTPIFLAGLLVLDAGLASGQGYPNKPIRVIASGAGGGQDFVARLIAPGIAAALGQPVIVENRAGGFVSSEIVAKALPDGYTLLITGTSFTVAPLLQKTPYDPVKDFSPVTLLDRAPNVLVIHPSLPVDSVKDLIALAKARPGEINYAAGSTGSASHLAAELFKSMAGVNIVHIPYKGMGPAIIGLLGNQVHLSFATTASIAPHIKSGKLKAIAITSAQPSALTPGLPTIAASGLPGYEVDDFHGILAPAKTPAAIIRRLNQEILIVLKSADVKEKLFNSGLEVVGSSPDEFAAKMKADIARTTRIIRDAGIRTQ